MNWIKRFFDYKPEVTRIGSNSFINNMEQTPRPAPPKAHRPKLISYEFCADKKIANAYSHGFDVGAEFKKKLIIKLLKEEIKERKSSIFRFSERSKMYNEHTKTIIEAIEGEK